MLFLALRSASLKSQSSLRAVLCFFEKPKLSCAALCFKPKLFFLKNEALKSFLLFVHLQHLINDVSVVGQSWHLVLSAELALRFEPVVE